MQVNKEQALAKAVNVFFSCKTETQLATAWRYAELVERAWRGAYMHDNVANTLDRMFHTMRTHILRIVTVIEPGTVR